MGSGFGFKSEFARSRNRGSEERKIAGATTYTSGAGGCSKFEQSCGRNRLMMNIRCGKCHSRESGNPDASFYDTRRCSPGLDSCFGGNDRSKALVLLLSGIFLFVNISLAHAQDSDSSTGYYLRYGHRASVAATQWQVSDTTISIVERAMNDELVRAKSDLHLAGLIDPFFIAYTVADQKKLEIVASNGALTRSEDHHERKETVRLLLNNYQFNDENFTDNTGLFSFSSAPDNALPLDDDYTGIRRVLWLSTDDLFKEANESFSKKKAALEHKQLSPELK